MDWLRALTWQGETHAMYMQRRLKKFLPEYARQDAAREYARQEARQDAKQEIRPTPKRALIQASEEDMDKQYLADLLVIAGRLRRIDRWSIPRIASKINNLQHEEKTKEGLKFTKKSKARSLEILTRWLRASLPPLPRRRRALA